MTESASMELDRRIDRGDTLAAYDVMVECREAIAALLPELGVTLIDDANALDRLRDLERLKPAFGTRPIIEGGRQAGERVTQETAATDRGGRERTRSAAKEGAVPGATAGKRARSVSC